MSSRMSSPLSETSRMLLGDLEVPYEGGHVSIKSEDHASDNDNNKGAEFTPLNANAGTLVKVNRKGDEIEIKKTKGDNVDAVKTSPKKRGATAAANNESSQPAKKHSPTKKGKAVVNTGADETAHDEADIVEPTTPKKRTAAKKAKADDATNDEINVAEPTTPKNRAAAKKLNDATAIKTENGDMEMTDAPSAEPVTPKKKRSAAKTKTTRVDTSGPASTEEAHDDAPVTPKKRIAVKANATKTDTEEADGGDAADKSLSPTKKIEMTVHNTPRKRQAPKAALAAPRGIPTSWESADDADKMLISMKEKGNDWAAIREAWKETTGQDTAPSTLPNRYNRIKINMLRLEDGDVVHLFAAKKEVEDTNAAAFWGNVAANMERRGSSKKYPTAFLQKTVRELELQGEEAAADGKDGGAKGGNGGEGMKEVDTDGSG